MAICIIGDVHGCFKTLKALVKKLPKEDKKVFVGDLIDKGPNSRGVVSFVKDNEFDVVMGNHEKMMLHDGGAFRIMGDWSRNGGLATLRSYADTPQDDALWEEHRAWIKALPYFIEYDVMNDAGQYLFVSHAGIPYNNLVAAVRSEEILWNRNKIPFQYENAFNVYGHTPKKKPIIESYYANIDTGCFFTRAGMGYLTALRFPQMELFHQENIDREHNYLNSKRRYFLMYEDDGIETVKDFSTETSALRWLAENSPTSRFRLIGGDEISISYDQVKESQAYVKNGGKWMDPLTKLEWEKWAKESLTSEERATRLKDCFDCTVEKCPPDDPCCPICGRMADDPIFPVKKQ